MDDKHDLFIEVFMLQVTYIRSLRLQLLTDLEIFAFCFYLFIFFLFILNLFNEVCTKNVIRFNRCKHTQSLTIIK